jgi:hypothetical protein
MLKSSVSCPHLGPIDYIIFKQISVAAGLLWGVDREALSLRSHGGGTPLPGPGEGDVTSPYSRSIAGTTVTSLLRGAGGFNHPRESLNPSLHTGGPRPGRSFRRCLRQWRS